MSLISLSYNLLIINTITQRQLKEKIVQKTGISPGTYASQTAVFPLAKTAFRAKSQVRALTYACSSIDFSPDTDG